MSQPVKPPQPTWYEYSPEWAPHVKGTFEERYVDPETGIPDPQTWKAKCTFDGCGAEHEGKCSSGSIRAWINKFATVHLHRDPLANPHYHRRTA